MGTEYQGEVRAFHFFPVMKLLGQHGPGEDLGARLISATCGEERSWAARPVLAAYTWALITGNLRPSEAISWRSANSWCPHTLGKGLQGTNEEYYN